MDKNGKGDTEEDEFIIKVRGLPWSTTVEEIIDFFNGCNIRSGTEGVFIVMTKEGRPSGEAFIEMETAEDVEKALKKDREYVGSRYIEVFKCKRAEMEWVVRRSGQCADASLDDGCVRLRGLPFGCSKEEIAQFFVGLEIMPNGITLPMDSRGRSTGEAFVQFRSKEIAEKALLKHKEKISHRYIEIFRSSLKEAFPEGRRPSLMFGAGGGRPAPYDTRDRFGGPNRFRGSGGGGGGMGMGMGNGMAHSRFRGAFNDDFDEDDDWPYGGGMGRGNMRGGPVGVGGGMGMGTMGMGMGGMGMGSNRSFSDFGGGGMNNFGGGYNGGGNSGPPGPHIVQMRGLPFRATKQDIADFFRPVIPLSIDLNTGDKGRAEVEFRTHDDALMAMTKDKSFMSHRYIELFLNKEPNGRDGRGGSRNRRF